MANFATAADALTTALAIVDARLTNVNVNEQLELYLELIERRAKIQQAIAASGGGGGGSSSATTVATTSASSQTISVTLLDSNPSRKWAAFRNDSTSVVYISKSSNAASDSSVYRLAPQGSLYFDDYTGAVTAIWVTANGFMRIEEGA